MFDLSWNLYNLDIYKLMLEAILLLEGVPRQVGACSTIYFGAAMVTRLGLTARSAQMMLYLGAPLLMLLARMP